MIDRHSLGYDWSLGMSSTRSFRYAALLALLALTAGCVNVAGRLADTLSDSIQRQNDIETVRDGAPAYLLMIDGLIEGDPRDSELLLAGANLYSAYAGAFVTDPERARRLARRALDYSWRALCVELQRVCAAADARFEEYQAALAEVDADAVAVLFGHGAAWAAWLQANSDDWQAIADIPKVQATMRRVVALDETHRQGAGHIYLGVLSTLLPPAMGGKPEQGRAHFERALALSQGANLMVHVLYAKHYARLVFDRELHDRLLNQVIAHEVKTDQFTLSNTLAQAQARSLLASAEDYF